MKQKFWEPPFISVPVNYLQQIIQEVVSAVLLGGSAQGSTTAANTSNAAIISTLNSLKDIVMTLSAQVQTIVDQVTATKTIEAASAAALAQLVTQAAANSQQITALMAQVAAGQSLSAADAAALTQSATDLHDSAVALQAAVPANTTP